MSERPTKARRLPPGLWTIQGFDQGHTARAERFGYRVVLTDLTGITTKADLLTTVSSDLEFSPSFGKNWDALDEALGDWVSVQTQTLWVIDRLEELRGLDPATARTFVDIAAEAAGDPQSAVTVLIVTGPPPVRPQPAD